MSLADDLDSIEPRNAHRSVSPLITLLDELHDTDRAGYRALVAKLDDTSIHWRDLSAVLVEHFGERRIGMTTINRWRNGQLHRGRHPIED